MNNSRFSDALVGIIHSIPHSYSTIFFSDSSLLGLVILAVTFLSPIIGLAGFIGLLSAILISRIMGFSVWDSKSGILSFNSLITSLAVGYYYPMQQIQQNPYLFLIYVLAASCFSLFLFIGLNYLTQTYLHMPAMSLSFSISALILWFYFVKVGYITGFFEPKFAFQLTALSLPRYWELYFVSLGSIMFMPNILAGLVIAIVLLVISRIGFLLSLLGWSVCYLLLAYLPGQAVNGLFFPGFNLILISLAIGGVYLIPSKSSWLLAILASVIGFYLALAMSSIYHHINPYTGFYTPLAIPIFAFPLNVVIIGMVFVLRLRLVQKSPVINEFMIFSPEKALEAYLGRQKRFSEVGTPQFALPVSGEWLITQGHHGEHTHQYEWAYAWDFEIEDLSTKRYATDPDLLADYYAYNKPVLAAAAGYVVKVISTILDNAIGEINTHHNWGNYVTISHGYGLYSFYAHLKAGSILVKEGEYVALGSKLAYVGNSGRSPLPHLHFQIQQTPEAGAKTIKSHLVNYKKLSAGEYEFISSGIPQAGDLISSQIRENRVQNLLKLSNLSEYRFSVSFPDSSPKSKVATEEWRVELDFMGIFRIVSSNQSVLEFSIYDGIYNALSLKPRIRGALYAFAMALSRYPYSERQLLSWKDNPSLSMLYHPILKELLLLISPLFSPVSAIQSSHQSWEGRRILIQSRTDIRILGYRLTSIETELQIDSQTGIEAIRLTKNGLEKIRVERILHTTETEV